MRLTLASLALVISACGVQFDPPHELETLRVLAVQKDPAYARPGETVTLQMLWHDALAGADNEPPRTVQRVWLGGCFNPPADLYYGCFAQFAEAASSAGAGELPPGIIPGFGDTFSLSIPQDIITTRPPPIDPGQPPFGVAYVFFAACAGTLDFGSTESGFPVVCRDAQGQTLGSEDFVAGYSAIFVYEDIRNANPILGDVELEGSRIAPDCVDDACLTTTTDAPDCTLRPELCIQRCAGDGESSCPEIEFRPSIDPTLFERDEVATLKSRSQLGEQVWINYYVDRGGLRNGVRLLNDAVGGFNDEHETALFAPKDPGPLRIWAVVHDNRGGVAWTRLTLRVE
jgi:hypothetical protein